MIPTFISPEAQASSIPLTREAIEDEQFMRYLKTEDPNEFDWFVDANDSEGRQYRIIKGVAVHDDWKSVDAYVQKFLSSDVSADGLELPADPDSLADSTGTEALSQVPIPRQFHPQMSIAPAFTEHTECPGPGWVESPFGTWVRKPVEPYVKD